MMGGTFSAFTELSCFELAYVNLSTKIAFICSMKFSSEIGSPPPPALFPFGYSICENTNISDTIMAIIYYWFCNLLIPKVMVCIFTLIAIQDIYEQTGQGCLTQSLNQFLVILVLLTTFFWRWGILCRIQTWLEPEATVNTVNLEAKKTSSISDLWIGF